MITRAILYDKFVRYVKTNLTNLTNIKAYYTNRLDIATNKLNIFRDSLSRHRFEFEAIYDIKFESLDTTYMLPAYNSILTTNESKLIDVVESLKKISKDYDKHTVMFVKAIVEEYLEIKNEIKTINRQLQLTDSKLSFFTKYSDTSKNIFYYIIARINKYYENLLLEGKTVRLGYDIGFIKITPKNVNGKINWAASFDYRKKLIEDGRIPYKEEDCLAAKSSNTPYNGVKWFVYYDNEVQHYINWYHYSKKLPNGNAYTFIPARYNLDTLKNSEMKKTIKDVKELDKLKIGIVNKLDIALHINELQFLKYADNDI